MISGTTIEPCFQAPPFRAAKAELVPDSAEVTEPAAGIKEDLKPEQYADPLLNPPFRAGKAEPVPDVAEMSEPAAGIKEDLQPVAPEDPPLNPPFRASNAEAVPDVSEIQEPAAGIKRELGVSNGASSPKRPRDEELEDDTEDQYRAPVPRGPVVKKGSECPYLDTISRQVSYQSSINLWLRQSYMIKDKAEAIASLSRELDKILYVAISGIGVLD